MNAVEHLRRFLELHNDAERLDIESPDGTEYRIDELYEHAGVIHLQIRPRLYPRETYPVAVIDNITVPPVNPIDLRPGERYVNGRRLYSAAWL